VTVKAPGSKHQDPKKLQIPNSKDEDLDRRAPMGALSLVLLWNLVLGSWSFSLITASSATAYLPPSADTALLENFPTNNMGGQTWLNAGTTQVFTKNRGLLKFDIATAIPAGARITTVSLTLHVTKSPIDGDLPSTFDLHRMLVDWGEGNKSGDPPLLGAEATLGEANWTHRLALTTNAWTTPGGAPGIDFASERSADTYVYGVNFSPYTFDLAANMTTDVQLWLDQPERNFGWMLKSRNESDNFSARRFASREDEFLSPLLVVDYSMVHFKRIARSGDQIILVIGAAAGQSFSVEYCDGLSGDLWVGLTNVPAQAEATVVHLDEPIVCNSRFYRLRSE
jgi:hypothetical protein